MTEIRRRTVWGQCEGGATSAHRGLFVLVLGAMMCGIPVFAADNTAVTEEDSRAVLALAREATTTVRTNLRTGRAKGSFRMWFGDNELVQSARLGGVFDGSKHYLQLVYEPTGYRGVAIEYDKRIVVCDGYELFVSRFSENIQPVGAEADIYPAGHRSWRTATQGFPASLKMLAAGILRSEVLDKKTAKVERLANGHLRGTYETTPNYHTTFEIAPEYGYHCILRESFLREKPAYRWSVAWQRTNDVWHVTSGRMERYEDGKQREAYE